MEESTAGRGAAWFAVGPSVKRERGVPPGWGWWESNGGALCVVDYRLVHGYVDVREAVWWKDTGAGRGGQGGNMVCRGALREKGEGRVPPGWGWWESNVGALCVVDCRLMHGYVDTGEAVWGEGHRSGGLARRDKRDSGKGRAVVSPWRITWKAGARGARARRDKGDGGKGRAVVSPRRITLRKGTRGARARRETTRRKKCRAKRKRRPGPPYLWYLEFCRIWKPR